MSWKCPTCRLFSAPNPVHFAQHIDDGKIPCVMLRGTFHRCQNPACRAVGIDVAVVTGDRCMGTNYSGPVFENATTVLRKRVYPAGEVPEPLHPSVPVGIRQDYEEAYSILELSAKASATLCRRALQGMIRDFHQEVRATLNLEIEAIRGKVDQDTWDAIDAVRKVGNIGAHMEKDVNIIIDVEPEESAKLLLLINMLSREWYQRRAERAAMLAEIKGLAATKTAAKKPQVP